MTKKARMTQADYRQKFGGEITSYHVVESALRPGEIQINQYASRLVGPLSPSAARELAANLIRAANTIEITKTLGEGWQDVVCDAVKEGRYREAFEMLLNQTQVLAPSQSSQASQQFKPQLFTTCLTCGGAGTMAYDPAHAPSGVRCTECDGNGWIPVSPAVPTVPQ